MHILIIAFALLMFSGCSSVQTQKAAVSISTIKSQERFQLMVRTGNPVMDKLLYEMAFQQFGNLIPLREKEPYTGVMEIVFLSSDQSSFIGSSSTIGRVNAYGSGWYTGHGQVGSAVTATGISTSLSTGGVLTWQNSTMLIILKKTDGERLWTADYNYKGGMEMSGFVVNTPDEAARLVLGRLKENFENDFNNN